MENLTWNNTDDSELFVLDETESESVSGGVFPWAAAAAGVAAAAFLYNVGSDMAKRDNANDRNYCSARRRR